MYPKLQTQSPKEMCANPDPRGPKYLYRRMWGFYIRILLGTSKNLGNYSP